MITVRPKDEKWYITNLRKLKRKLDLVHRTAKQLNNVNSWEKFRKSRNDYIQNCRSARDIYFDTLNNNLQDTSRIYSKD